MENGTVSVSHGYTMNIGNYESMRFDFGVTEPILDGESTTTALKRVDALVSEYLVERVNEERQALKAKRAKA